ncbi:MAG: sensor histidine kinase [Emergencia sp.]
MIKKLRIKLVTAAMLSLIVVLAVIIGTVGALNYRNIMTGADQKLQILAENGGVFPDSIGKKSHGFSPEMPFESRYFSVELDDDNTVQSVNTGRIAAVNETQAIAYAERIVRDKKTNGFADTYRFRVYTDTNGSTYIYFLDCFRDLQSFRSFLLNSTIVSGIGLLAVLILLHVSSQYIVRPISESYEKQKRFITDAGHELKTPLTIISADAEVLEMDFGENEWLNDIRSQTERLSDLTSNLVYLSRMEEQPQIEAVDFSLSDAVREAADDFYAVAKMKGKTLNSSVEPDLIMRGDEKTICRLIAIFLDNAVKYTNENGMIRITLDKWRGQLRLQVYNTTDYIKRDSIAHLFDRFYRTDQSRNSQTGGYGLGLSIASAIVASHNGKLTATTSDEKSLLITVTFPGKNI